jgi:hypothetical protein
MPRRDSQYRRRKQLQWRWHWRTRWFQLRYVRVRGGADRFAVQQTFHDERLVCDRYHANLPV